MNGFEAVRALRKANIVAPILVISGDLRTETHVKALESGADGYVTKPFHPDELIARIRALVRFAHRLVHRLRTEQLPIVGEVGGHNQRSLVLTIGAPASASAVG